MSTKNQSESNVSEHQIKQAIRGFKGRFGYSPYGPVFEEETRFTLEQVYAYYDSFADAVEEAGLSLENRPTGMSVAESEVKRDLERVADELSHCPHSSEYQDMGRFSIQMVKEVTSETTSSWGDCLVELGLTDSFESTPRVRIECPICEEEKNVSPSVTKTCCSECGNKIEFNEGHINARRDAKLIDALSDSPIVATQDMNRHDAPHAVREIVDVIRAPPTRDFNHIESPDNPDEIIYLIGDERRAVDVFIEKNKNLVEQSLGDKSMTNPFKSNWPNEMYLILQQQYYWNHID